MAGNGSAGAVLRAKYLDWCSAKIADRFLALTPEEIYELAHDRRDARGSSGGASRIEVDGFRPQDLSYQDLVSRVTEALASRLPLPSFERWLETYRSDPAVVEQQLMGLWRQDGRGVTRNGPDAESE